MAGATQSLILQQGLIDDDIDDMYACYDNVGDECVSDEEYQAILASIQDIKEGRYEDYNIVFDRVEKSILDAMVSNRFK